MRNEDRNGADDQLEDRNDFDDRLEDLSEMARKLRTPFRRLIASLEILEVEGADQV